MFNSVFRVQELGEIEGDSDMNVGQGSHVSSNIFKEKFWFCKVEALRLDEFRIQVRKLLTMAHFEEAVEDEEEFWEIGGKSSANNIFLTLAKKVLRYVF